MTLTKAYFRLAQKKPCARHFRLALLAPNVWGGTLDAGPHTDRFYNKWGQKYWDLWLKSLPLILALSSPGLPEIIIFGHVRAILRRPTMFRMHNLIRQVDKKVDSIMKSCFMQKHSQSMQLDLRSLLLDTSPHFTLKTEFVIKRKTIVKSFIVYNSLQSLWFCPILVLWTLKRLLQGYFVFWTSSSSIVPIISSWELSDIV